MFGFEDSLFLSHTPSPLSSPSLFRIVVNVSGAPVLWRVGEDGFQRSSLVEGTIMWFQQASDGLVVPDHSLPLGHNYFLSKAPPPSQFTYLRNPVCSYVEQKISPHLIQLL